MLYIFRLLILLLLLSPSFAFGKKNLDGDLYQYTVGAAHFEEKEKYRLQIVHPYRFDPISIKKSMASLFYQQRTIGWSKKKRIFRLSMIKKLTPILVKQFSKADHNQRIIFAIKSPRGKTFIKGDTFLSPEGLNWRFTVINSKKRGIDDFSVMGESWKMVPKIKQAYRKKKRSNNIVQDITNWIIATNIRPEPSNIIVIPQPGSSAKNTPVLGIKKKLRILEDLKNEGLINEQEYRTKRKEILDSF